MNMALIQGWALGSEAAGGAVSAHRHVGLGSPYTGGGCLGWEEGQGKRGESETREDQEARWGEGVGFTLVLV